MTVHPENDQPPYSKAPQRVKIVLKYAQSAQAPRRVASREAQLIAARPVLNGGKEVKGRHRKPSPDSWLCLAATVLAGWAPTLRVCLLLAVGGAIVVGAIVTTTPTISAPVSTVAAGLSLLGVWTIRARQKHVPSL